MRRLVFLGLIALLAVLPLWSAGVADKNPANAWLGLYTQTVDKDLKEAFRLDVDHGVIVNQVIPDSPADKAGLQQGDIILSIDGAKLTGSDQLAELVSGHKPGDQIKVEILRKGVQKEMTATIGERKGEEPPRIFGDPGSLSQAYSKKYVMGRSNISDTYIGVNLESLNAQLGEYFGVKDGQGALITEVFEDSPAQKAGLKAGDVITQIDGKEVTEPADVQKAVGDKSKGDKLNLTILRDRARLEMAVEVAETPDNFYSLPDIQAPDIPRDMIWFNGPMRGLLRGNFDDSNPDMEGMQESIKQLKEQIEELQQQMKNMQNNPGK
ncbi:MAG: PDZ domain-containing protein [candidate division Zixibacteria bacterium]|nr:PDZ domain-containing protein [candidate division Zixibacteria bacterium]